MLTDITAPFLASLCTPGPQLFNEQNPLSARHASIAANPQ